MVTPFINPGFCKKHRGTWAPILLLEWEFDTYKGHEEAIFIVPKANSTKLMKKIPPLKKKKIVDNKIILLFCWLELYLSSSGWWLKPFNFFIIVVSYQNRIFLFWHIFCVRNYIFQLKNVLWLRVWSCVSRDHSYFLCKDQKLN